MAEKSQYGVVTNCKACGARVLAAAEICPTCGVRQHGVVPASPSSMPLTSQDVQVSDRKILPAVLLCGLLGVFGAHRFYVGRTGTAIAQLLTLGGLGIWMLVDLIMLLTENFRDDRGRTLVDWM